VKRNGIGLRGKAGRVGLSKGGLDQYRPLDEASRGQERRGSMIEHAPTRTGFHKAYILAVGEVSLIFEFVSLSSFPFLSSLSPAT